MIPKLVLNRCKPLFFTESGLIICKRNTIFLLKKNLTKQKILSFPTPFFCRILNRSKLFYRLLRSGVYSSIGFENDYYFCFEKKLYKYDVSLKRLSEELKFSKGHGPLNFTVINNIKGFSNCLSFGEYYNNPSKACIKIYSKSTDTPWKAIHSFGEGEINHIHNLIPDKYRNCVWILAGDFGDAASIWQARNDFKSIRKILGGNQVYRSCVAFPLEEGLLYATDTQFEGNSVRLLRKNKSGDWTSKSLYRLNGSCIHGCELRDHYVFSTSTEPDSVKKSKVRLLLDNKPGPGIKKNKSDIILCSKKDLRFRVFHTHDKDFWPYRLFQFGNISFPKGPNATNEIYGFNVGSKSNDLATEVWEADKLCERC